ncbi:hypothetical protein [Streptomyces yunnanensis]|uniref:Secreted protein n=1 Tax=Streptomyces yunnanensis TaxID=156453 RepID=A0A9X8MSV2_9ACTN|nr:hypothetical protein [Streptomyces yunnanensis]SHL66024.1 hypothetical protein SAMN05216268_105391 [Streptomyces yunnanensis]
MPRGRHRHSPPLHRLLPPSTVAGASIACATGAWFVGDDLVQRVLAAGAAAAAVTGAVLLRSWDRKAGKRVAELTRARVRDEWRTEERVAELETDVEEAREIRAGLDAKLRAKRAELARLRSEHAALLRRYATAETERASALEGRRLLAIEAGQPSSGGELVPARREPATGGGRPVPAARDADGAAPARPAATFAEADRALRELARNAARQRAAAEHAGPDGSSTERKPEATDQGKIGAAAVQGVGGPALRPVPAAAAIAPTRPPVPRTLGGFDFFGNTTVPRQQLTARLEEDLADVVGDEAVAEQSARAEARAALPPAAGATTAAALPESEAVESDATEPAAAEHDTAAGADGEASGEEAPGKTVADGATTHGAGEVIDLTAHDETEQLDLAELRSAIS